MKTTENKPYFYWDEDSEMYMINNFMAWKAENHEEGDSLWRAGIAYMCYNSDKIKKGILKAFRKREDGKYQACRYNPQMREDDVSRDQVILALASLKFNGDEEELKEIALNLPFKLSKRFIMTPNLWLWLRGISGSKWYDYLNQLYMLIEYWIVLPISSLSDKAIGAEHRTQDELEYNLETYGEHNIRSVLLDTKFKRLMYNLEFSGYALHLSMWLVYLSRDTKIKKILVRKILKTADKDNLLARLMFSDDVTIEDIDNYKPMEEWRWSQYMTDLTRTRIIPTENLGNNIKMDKDILYKLYFRKNEKTKI